MKILWIFLGGHHKIRLYLGVISLHFWIFLSGQGTEWGYFFWGWGAKISEYLRGVLEIPVFFFCCFLFFLGGGG